MESRYLPCAAVTRTNGEPSWIAYIGLQFLLGPKEKETPGEKPYAARSFPLRSATSRRLACGKLRRKPPIQAPTT
jgi:hypothetical protein